MEVTEEDNHQSPCASRASEFNSLVTFVVRSEAFGSRGTKRNPNVNGIRKKDHELKLKAKKLLSAKLAWIGPTWCLCLRYLYSVLSNHPNTNI